VMAGVAGRRARVSGLGAGVSEMATAVRRGEVRVEDQVAKVLRTIADRDATIRAFVSLDAERFVRAEVGWRDPRNGSDFVGGWKVHWNRPGESMRSGPVGLS